MALVVVWAGGVTIENGLRTMFCGSNNILFNFVIIFMCHYKSSRVKVQI